MDRRLAAKDKHNVVTMALFLLIHWFHAFVLTLLGLLALGWYSDFGAVAFAVTTVVATVFSGVYFALVERAAGFLLGMGPQFCSIYDPYFWRQERAWKLESPRLYGGTPFKNVLLRIAGARIGKRVFDDGCIVTDKTLVTIGDDCTLSEGSEIQCHSLEDGTFKADYTALGSDCTLAPGPSSTTG